MKHFALILCLAATPLAAQDTNDEPSLMQQGMELFFKGLKDELDPALQELDSMMDGLEPSLRNFAQTMGPALADLLNNVEDWSLYEAPEVLPNGDIIIRKKPEVSTPKDDGITL